jgi:predicted dehydrogenase
LDQAEEAYALIGGKTAEPYLGVLFEYNHLPPQRETRVVVRRQGKNIAGRLGVGMIGAGNFAQSMLLPHLNQHPEVDLCGVVTLNPLESRDVAERFGFAYMASDAQEFFADETIQAVVIATRHDSHAELALQALQAGKAIHLEKPLALTSEQLKKICDTYYNLSNRNLKSESGSPFLMVGFNRRFAPMVQAAADFIRGRQEPVVIAYRINAGYIPPDHWTQDPQQGGGRIIGEVCHFIDLIQFFAGARVQRVHAEALPDRGKYHQDNVVISLSLEDGSVGTICYVANGDKALPKERFEIYTGGKVAILDDYRSLTLINNGKMRTSRQGARDKGHKAEMEAWVDAIRHGHAEPVPFEDAVCATKATFAALRSLAERQAVAIEDV